jgi:hypothetical protein
MWYVKKSFCQVDHFFIFPHTSENMKNRWLSAAWLLHRWFTLTRGTSSHISSRVLFFLFFALVALDHTRNLGSTISISFHSDDWLSPVFAPFLSPYFFFISFFFGWKWFNLSNREMTAWALPLRPLNVQIDEKMWDIFLWAVTFLSFCSSRFCYINRKSHIAAWAPEAVHSAPTSILLKPILYFFQIYRGNLFVQKDKQGGRKRGKWWQRTS